MHTELFGIFGDRDAFCRYRDGSEFDRVVAGDRLTIGLRDPHAGLPGRTDLHRGSDGLCVVWGEAFPPPNARRSVAEWLLDRYASGDEDAFGAINGSYLVVIECDDHAMIVTDPVQSWECFYAETPAGRVFGTDAARVARTVETPTLDDRTLCEFLHFGVTFGDRTLLGGVRRLPFDGYLTAADTGHLSRFVYDPREFEYAADLAARLERAIRRRSHYPGDRGILMSAGYDSRLLLSALPELDRGYTLGTPTTPEVRVARRLAAQYGVNHRSLSVSEDYLNTAPDVVRCTQGIRESLHIHHRGNVPEIDATTVYHGLLLDTFLRGNFLPRDTIHMFDRQFPLSGLDPDPDVPAFFGEKYGFFDEGDRLLVESDAIDATTPEQFRRNTVTSLYEAGFDRADSPHNAMSLVGAKIKAALPFRTHLADRFLESFVAVDSELLEWHLRTPPEHRNDRTYQRALSLLDEDIFRHRPPDRPYRSHKLNQIEQFARKVVPGVTPFGTPWPDRDRIYEEHDLDRQLLPGREHLHPLPPRIKLRINDALTWLDLATDDVHSTDEILVEST